MVVPAVVWHWDKEQLQVVLLGHAILHGGLVALPARA